MQIRLQVSKYNPKELMQYTHTHTHKRKLAIKEALPKWAFYHTSAAILNWIELGMGPCGWAQQISIVIYLTSVQFLHHFENVQKIKI